MNKALLIGRVLFTQATAVIGGYFVARYLSPEPEVPLMPFAIICLIIWLLGSLRHYYHLINTETV